MACHCLHLKNASEFYTLLKQRDPDLIKKMVKCVMSAYKRNKADIDIFDITFKDMSELTFNIERSQYSELLSNCLKDMIEIKNQNTGMAQAFDPYEIGMYTRRDMAFTLFNPDANNLNDNKIARQEIGASIINMAFARVAMAA